MHDIFAARNRKIIPVLLGVFILNICAQGAEIFSANSAPPPRSLR